MRVVDEKLFATRVVFNTVNNETYVVATMDNVECKVKAMQTHTGETQPDPHPRSGEVIKALAKVRGSEARIFYAEAYLIQKSFT